MTDQSSLVPDAPISSWQGGGYGRQDVVLIAVAQLGLENLARGGVRNFRHEHDIVRYPPVGGLASHKAEYLVLACRLTFLEHHDQERPLVPLRMLNADDGRFRYFRMSNREGPEIDRGNPLAAGFDHVLGTIGDLHVSVAVDGGDVAGVEEAVLVEDPGVFLEIAARNRKAAGLEPAESLTVAWKLPAH